jgi:hypothetical protein
MNIHILQLTLTQNKNGKKTALIVGSTGMIGTINRPFIG